MSADRLFHKLQGAALALQVLLIFQLAACASERHEPEVLAIDGRLPPWVRRVERDNINGITCWVGHGGEGTTTRTCFRDRVECPAPVAP